MNCKHVRPLAVGDAYGEDVVVLWCDDCGAVARADGLSLEVKEGGRGWHVPETGWMAPTPICGECSRDVNDHAPGCDAPTVGPWAAFTAGTHTNIVSMTERTRVVFSLPGHDKNEPNVRLATAAPELLAALGRLVNSPVAGSGDYILSERDVANARAAIAKAVGS